MTDGPDAPFNVLSDRIDQVGFSFGGQVRDVVWLFAAVDAEQREARFGVGRTRHVDVDLGRLDIEFGHGRMLIWK